MYVFLARDLFPSTLPQDDDEFLTVVQLTPNQIAAKVRDGDIQDAKTLAVLYLAGIGLPPTSLG
jgi:hypothetical protein